LKKWLITSLLCVAARSVPAQVSEQEIMLLQQLDSISRSASVARHFAALYFETTANAAGFFSSAKPDARHFIIRFETAFAGYFFHSVSAYNHGDTIPPVWKSYFSDTGFLPLQYQLLGINAHINGDIWQAMTSAFSWEELQNHKKDYMGFQKSLVKQYHRFFETSVTTHSKTRLLHRLSLGLDKFYGRLVLMRWRQRQWKLARLWYTRKDLFHRKRARVERKREHLNRLIINSL
jgi:hypothetical protein